MKFEVDTNKVSRWLRAHLLIVIPAGMFALSWLAGKNAGGNNFIDIWWGIVSAVGLLGAIATTIVYLIVVLDPKQN